MLYSDISIDKTREKSNKLESEIKFIIENINNYFYKSK
ncbi:Glycerol-3-phosphate dehydrogenase [Borrelia anserina BA2]|uniref:Glycerol-3-phosphate dehydrogenase n=1 Tax=Borrelia anserina BA2 TaxID=1313293 RepID=W5SNJ1_BORAN|nr:Glycerol-3-phosphate dehydrogenase [Borrelia anserina BA2]